MANREITTERSDLFDVSITIAISVGIKGQYDPERVRGAFNKALAAHEVFSTRVVLDSLGRAEFVPYPANSGNSIEFTEADTESVIREQEKKRFRIEDGEYLRAFVSRDSGAADSFSVLFLMHHLGGDGKSLVYFIESFMKALSGTALEYVPMRLMTPSDIPGGKLPFIYKLWLKGKNREWRGSGRVFTFDDLQKSHDLYWSRHGSRVGITTYGSDELARMKEQAHEGGYRLTAYFITEFLKTHDGVQDVGLAVDARTDSNRAMGNQATGISVKLAFDPKLSFDANARRVQKELDRKLNDPMYKYFILRFMAYMDPTLVDALNMQHTGYYDSDVSHKLAETMGYLGKTKDLSITNLTKLDIPLEYGGYGITGAVFIPPVISYGKNILGIVTCGDRMSAAVHTVSETDRI